MKEPRPEVPNFLDLIEKVYEKEEKDYKPSEGYRHNPSSATMVTDGGRVVGSCLRALYWKATKEPVSDSRQLTSKLQGDFGNGIHSKLQDLIGKSSSVKITAESAGKLLVEPLTKEISFRLDGLVTHKGETGCLEIKTMNSFSLTKMVREGGPKEKDILQVLCYFGTNEDIRWASLVYVGRDTAFRAEYHIFRDPESKVFVIQGVTPTKSEKPIRELSFEKVVERWKVLEQHVERAELPQRDYKAVLSKEGVYRDKRERNSVTYESDFACRFCSYKTKCWSLPDAKEYSYQLDY